AATPVVRRASGGDQSSGPQTVRECDPRRASALIEGREHRQPSPQARRSAHAALLLSFEARSGTSLPAISERVRPARESGRRTHGSSNALPWDASSGITAAFANEAGSN